MISLRRVLALVALLLASSTAAQADQPAPAPLTVNELLARPTEHYDQRFSIMGVVHYSGWGPKLCELPSRAREPGFLDNCIDFATADLPIGYYGSDHEYAIVKVVGYFSFTCPPPDPADKSEYMVVCIDRGGRGYINVESMTRIGYAACDGDRCNDDANPDAHEVAFTDPQVSGADAMAHALLAAARAHDIDRLVGMVLPSQRTETRFDAGTAKGFEQIFGAFARVASPAAAGRSYRLFLVEGDSYRSAHHELCFCTKGDCTHHWPELTTMSFDRSWEIVCVNIWRSVNVWYLVY